MKVYDFLKNGREVIPKNVNSPIIYPLIRVDSKKYFVYVQRTEYYSKDFGLSVDLK